MTSDEFLELRQWMVDRWPALGHLSDGQWVAYREELGRFDVSNVWSAVQMCFGSGDEYPPGVAKLARLAGDEEKHRQRAALPAGGGVSWAEYSRQRWGEVVPLLRAAKEIVEGVRE